jgi:outer membrane lipoprotein
MENRTLSATCRRPAIAASLLALAALAIAGCEPPLFADLLPRVQKGLAFPAVLQNPTQYTGAVVIWGGVILSTTNSKTGSEVVVLETPLDASGVPLPARYSRGRFIAKTPAFLDPEVFRRDRRVTFGGEVVGSEARPLGDTQYTYPVLNVLRSAVWGEPTSAYYYPYYGAYWGPYWGPYWDSFWDPFWPRYGYSYGFGYGWGGGHSHGHGHRH